MRKHEYVVAAARRVLRVGDRYKSWALHGQKGNHGPDIPLILPMRPLTTLVAGFVECKIAWDSAGKGNGRKSLYDGLGKLMLYGRAVYDDIPLALFFAASGFDDDGKPILTRERQGDQSVEDMVRKNLHALKVDLIVCGENDTTCGADGLFLKQLTCM